MPRASGKSRNRSATGSVELTLGQLVRRKHDPTVRGRVVEFPQPPLVRVEWGETTLLHWRDDLEPAGPPRKLSLRDQLRHRIARNRASPRQRE